MLFTLALSQVADGPVIMSRYMDDRLVVRTPMTELHRPIVDPLDSTKVFKFQSSGYGRLRQATALQADYRIQVYVLTKPELSLASRSCTYLLFLWDILTSQFGLEQPFRYEGVVTAFLRPDGKPGGEQKIVTTKEGNTEVKRNAIFINDNKTLTDPLEMCRELAHEYGHAVFHNIGGWDAPEFWGNGYLGERLFLKYLAKGIAAKEINPPEVFDLDPSALNAWVKRNCEEPAAVVFRNGFDPKALDGKGQIAFDAWISLMMAADSLYGPRLLGRAMTLSNGDTPADSYTGLGRALLEQTSLTIHAPMPIFWLYLPGEWMLKGGKTLETKSGGWRKVDAGTAKTIVATRKEPGK